MELELSKQYLFKNETKNDGSVVSKHNIFSGKNNYYVKLAQHNKYFVNTHIVHTIYIAPTMPWTSLSWGLWVL